MLASTPSTFSQGKAAGLRCAGWQQDSLGCLPTGEAAGSSAGLAHPWDWSVLSQSVVGRRAMSSLSTAAHRDRQSYIRSAHPCQPGKQFLLPTQSHTQHKAQGMVCRVAPHLGSSQPPGSLSLPSSLKAAVHVPLILQQWHQ